MGTFYSRVSAGAESCENANIQITGCDYCSCSPDMSDWSDNCKEQEGSSFEGTNGFFVVCSISFSGYEATEASYEGTADTPISMISTFEELGQALEDIGGGIGSILGAL